MIPILSDMHNQGKSPEILFWVGCAGSYDARAQKVTKAFASILTQLKINYAILGNEEKCTGDPARRAGNEFLFQMMALQNIETLNMYAVKKIVTACPHCFNTIKNEYPALGGNYEVIHHSQYLKGLIDSGILRMSTGENSLTNAKITMHDSCYLGRVNGEYEAPRDIVSSLQIDIKEMRRSKANGLCCGAGGAQMYKEDEAGKKRINTERIDEVLQTGADILAVNCPFCLTMMTDGLKAKEKQDQVMVYDLAELIVQQGVI